MLKYMLSRHLLLFVHLLRLFYARVAYAVHTSEEARAVFRCGWQPPLMRLTRRPPFSLLLKVVCKGAPLVRSSTARSFRAEQIMYLRTDSI